MEHHHIKAMADLRDLRPLDEDEFYVSHACTWLRRLKTIACNVRRNPTDRKLHVPRTVKP
jgi:hypothetical protein